MNPSDTFMKKILFSIIFLFNILFSQQFPIGVFRITNDRPPSVIPGVNDTITQLQKIFPLLRDGYFNNGVAFTQSSSQAYINRLLDSANVHGIGIMLPAVVDSYAGVERFYYASSSMYFLTVGGQPENPDNDVEIPLGITSSYYAKQSRKANSTSDYLVSTPRYNPSYIADQNYRATFRLKVNRPTTLDATDQIALLEVYNGGTTISRTLTSADFPFDNTYKTFSIDFVSLPTVVSSQSSQSQIPPPPDMPNGQTAVQLSATRDTDIRVKWLGSGELWFDNVRVDGKRDLGPNYAENFFNGTYNTEIRNKAIAYINQPALSRFYLDDEPFVNQYFASRKIDSLLQSAGANTTTGKGIGHAAIDDYWYSNDFSRYAAEAQPFELAPDIYRFFYSDPLPTASNYTIFTQLGSGDPITGYRSGLQTQIGKFRNAQVSSINTLSGKWWYYPNIGLWNPPGKTISREPYLSEIYVQVYLALAYGAKGLMYFNFWSDDYNASANTGVIGLINEDLTPITNSRYGENKWNGIKLLNQKLAGKLGQTLLGLTWQNGFSIHLLTSNNLPTGNYIRRVKTNQGPQIESNAQMYVELGLFKDNLNIDYFMLVNRRTISTEQRQMNVYFNDVTSQFQVCRIDNSKFWVFPRTNGQMVDTLQPGEGMLYYKYPYGTPSAPTNLSYTVISGHPKLAWISSNELDIVRYDIYRDGNLIGTSNGLEYTDYDVVISSNNPYTALYNVQAVDVTNLVSNNSNTIHVSYYGMQKKGEPATNTTPEPTEFSFKQNFPNPFNPSTNISYEISEDAFVTIKIYNQIGQELTTLVNNFKTIGRYSLEWNASSFPSGVYFCKIQAGKFSNTQKMILTK